MADLKKEISYEKTKRLTLSPETIKKLRKLGKSLSKKLDKLEIEDYPIVGKKEKQYAMEYWG